MCSKLRRVAAAAAAVATVMFNGCAVKSKTYRVGILSGSDAFLKVSEGFRAEMTELGYVEGRNIVYDMHALNADPAGEIRIARKFVSEAVDLIFAFPSEPAISAKKAADGTKIPVLFACANVERTALIESISKPGGNVTGIRHPGPDLTIKRLEILLDLAPGVKRVYAVYDRNYPAIPPALDAIRAAAKSLGVAIIEDPVSDEGELKTALARRSASGDIGVDAILIMPETLTQSPAGWALVSGFAAEHKLPVAGSAAFEAESGAVFSYIPDNKEIGALAAPIADKIFKGTSAGEIFVVTPVSRLRLNYRLARELKLSISESMMRMANEVIR